MTSKSNNKHGLFAAVAGLAFSAAVVTGPAFAADSGKFTDRYVKQTMIDTFHNLPDHMKIGDKIVTFDLKSPEKVMVPIEDARRIMKEAGVGSIAFICKRLDLQISYRNALLYGEKKSNKWSDQQLHFMSRLFMQETMNSTSLNAKDEAGWNKRRDELAKKICTKDVMEQLPKKVKLKWDSVKKTN